VSRGVTRRSHASTDSSSRHAIATRPNGGPIGRRWPTTCSTVPSGRIIRYRSFASKFAHFFISHDRFPIHDSYAADMLRAHLGPRAPHPDSDATYMDRAEAFWELAESAGPGADTHRLDRYLRIVGQYRKWAQNRASRINWELRGVFEADPPELKRAAGERWYAPRAMK
jgi:hypothetical protein